MIKRIFSVVFVVVVCLTLTACFEKKNYEVPVGELYFKKSDSLSIELEDPLNKVFSENDPISLIENARFDFEAKDYKYNFNDGSIVTKVKFDEIQLNGKAFGGTVIEGEENSAEISFNLTIESVKEDFETKAEENINIKETKKHIISGNGLGNAIYNRKNSTLTIIFPKLVIKTSTNEKKQELSTTNSAQKELSSPILSGWDTNQEYKDYKIIFDLK